MIIDEHKLLEEPVDVEALAGGQVGVLAALVVDLAAVALVADVDEVVEPHGVADLEPFPLGRQVDLLDHPGPLVAHRHRRPVAPRQAHQVRVAQRRRLDLH